MRVGGCLVIAILRCGTGDTETPRPGEMSEGSLGQGQPELLARGQNEDDAMARESPLGKRMDRPAPGLQGGSEGLQYRTLDLLWREALRLALGVSVVGLSHIRVHRWVVLDNVRCSQTPQSLRLAPVDE